MSLAKATWIEIRAVGRQKTHDETPGCYQGGDTGNFVARETVEHDDIPQVQFGSKQLIDLSSEDLGVDCAFDDERGSDALGAQGRDEGGSLPVAVGRLATHR